MNGAQDTPATSPTLVNDARAAVMLVIGLPGLLLTGALLLAAAVS